MRRKTFDSIRTHLALDASGGLSLNEQAMILMPSHFFLYVMEQVEAIAGVEVMRKIFRNAGYEGAITFCRRFREAHECTPREAVEGYLEEMSLRGWGQYQILSLSEERCTLEVLLHNSALRHARLQGPRHEVWAAAMEGAMTFLAENIGYSGRLEGKEVAFGPGDPPNACRIHVRPPEVK